MNLRKILKTVYPAAIAVVLYFLIQLLRELRIVNNYHVQIMMFAGINVIMTVSLNLVNGFTGQFCIGHAGFMSLGAYGAAVVTTMLFGGAEIAKGAQIPVFLLGLLA